jgi:uncharacterized protein (DUF1330 family)
MAFYFIAHIKIIDETLYQNYLNKVDEVFEKYNGKYLCTDDSPQILEGEWNYSKVVVIQFNTKKDFEMWYHSDDYQEILHHRLASAHCDTILANGNE